MANKLLLSIFCLLKRVSKPIVEILQATKHLLDGDMEQSICNQKWQNLRLHFIIQLQIQDILVFLNYTFLVGTDAQAILAQTNASLIQTIKNAPWMLLSQKSPRIGMVQPSQLLVMPFL